jgi:nucleotide-binding universal stress UspA family protein
MMGAVHEPDRRVGARAARSLGIGAIGRRPAMFRHILVPLDGSEFGERALSQAEELARATGARITLFAVLLRPEGPDHTEHPRVAKLDEQSRDRLLGELDDTAKAARQAGVESVETAVEFGEPAHRISEYAGANDVDLIVMSTHGLGATGRYALGSVALKVLMTAPCPVFMVRIPSHGGEQPS